MEQQLPQRDALVGIQRLEDLVLDRLLGADGPFQNRAARFGDVDAVAAGLFGVGLLLALLILPTDGAARARSANAEASGEFALSVEGA